MESSSKMEDSLEKRFPVGSLWVSPSLRAIDAKRSSLDRLVGAELFCVIVLNESADYVDVVCLDGDKMTLTHGELEFYYERA